METSSEILKRIPDFPNFIDKANQRITNDCGGKTKFGQINK